MQQLRVNLTIRSNWICVGMALLVVLDSGIIFVELGAWRLEIASWKPTGGAELKDVCGLVRARKPVWVCWWPRSLGKSSGGFSWKTRICDILEWMGPGCAGCALPQLVSTGCGPFRIKRKRGFWYPVVACTFVTGCLFSLLRCSLRDPNDVAQLAHFNHGHLELAAGADFDGHTMSNRYLASESYIGRSRSQVRSWTPTLYKRFNHLAPTKIPIPSRFFSSQGGSNLCHSKVLSSALMPPQAWMPGTCNPIVESQC